MGLKFIETISMIHDESLSSQVNNKPYKLQV